MPMIIRLSTIIYSNAKIFKYRRKTVLIKLPFFTRWITSMSEIKTKNGNTITKIIKTEG